MTVSVAMATYNGEKFIREQLCSIVNQTVKPDEIVICDDCSTDNTLRIVQNYANDKSNINWKIIRNDNNQGYIKNFFNAIKNTTGDIIILCDQDDVWDDHKIQFFVDLFINNDDMLSLHTDYSIIDQDGNLISDNAVGYQYDLEKYSLHKFSNRLNYCGMSSAFRSVIKDVLLRIDPSTLPTHDWTVHALSVVRRGMYVSNRVTSFRRYTGMNVALNIDRKTKREGLVQRISVVSEYYKDYCLLNAFAIGNCSESDLQYISDLIKVQDNRLEYLRKRNIWKWMTSVKYIKKYPSKKAYACDGLYILGIF